MAARTVRRTSYANSSRDIEDLWFKVGGRGFGGIVGGRLMSPTRDGAAVDEGVGGEPVAGQTSDGPAAFVPVQSVPRQANQDRFVVLQKWEGQVDEVDGNSMIVKLFDLMGNNPTEVAKISLDEISDPDLPLVVPGSVFYWSVGYRNRLNGQKTRESVIRFRRLPTWTKQDLQEADSQAEQWSRRLNWA